MFDQEFEFDTVDIMLMEEVGKLSTKQRRQIIKEAEDTLAFEALQSEKND
jgi:hypothetical protein